MRKYAVAVASRHTNINKVIIVKANTPREAILQAVVEYNNYEYIDFDSEFQKTKDMTIEEILEYYFDCDFLVSEPVNICNYL